MKHKGTVWTVGVPKGRERNADISTQTALTLRSIDERLKQAGTDKGKIIEATVFLTNMKEVRSGEIDAMSSERRTYTVLSTSQFKGFDKEWRAWLPEGGASRATVGVARLANNDKVEIKVTAAA